MKWKSLAIAVPLSLCLGAHTAFADPSVEFEEGAIITEGITDAVEAKLKKEDGLKTFSLQECGDADLARLCSLFPDMETLQITNSSKIKNLAPLAGLKNLVALEIEDCGAADLSPLAGLTGLTTLHVDAAMIDLTWMEKLTNLTLLTLSSEKLTSLKGLPKLPELTDIIISGGVISDLSPLVEAMPALQTLGLREMSLGDMSPLAQLTSLESLDLYGSKIKSFAPLSGCKSLVSLNFYGTEDADYASLGRISSLKELEGGMSGLKDIGWITQLPGLKSFSLFKDPVQDFSPLAKSHLETLKLSEMDGGKTFDLAYVAGIAGLKELVLDDMAVSNFEVLSSLKHLERITLTNVKGAGDLSAIKHLSSLQSVVVDEDVPESALNGFAPGVEISRD
ncbi:MAG: hypothetical protein K5657_00540 [Desulfovibrio sp.]|nr:hypothetical protein [Desulfovibrio sp.]